MNWTIRYFLRRNHTTHTLSHIVYAQSCLAARNLFNATCTGAITIFAVCPGDVR